jgi:outer membrane scaffolding protein for murein synthesis (MipA/OmpV family)
MLENTLTRVKEEAKKSPLVARAAPYVVLFSIDK